MCAETYTSIQNVMGRVGELVCFSCLWANDVPAATT